jgi:hypothetical protein
MDLQAAPARRLAPVAIGDDFLPSDLSQEPVVYVLTLDAPWHPLNGAQYVGKARCAYKRICQHLRQGGAAESQWLTRIVDATSPRGSIAELGGAKYFAKRIYSRWRLLQRLRHSVQVELVEIFPLEVSDELLAERELHWIRKLKPVLNYVIQPSLPCLLDQQ